jgi:hypothetical protein
MKIKMRVVKPKAKMMSSDANSPGHGFMCYYGGDVVEIDLDKLLGQWDPQEYISFAEFVQTKLEKENE